MHDTQDHPNGLARFTHDGDEASAPRAARTGVPAGSVLAAFALTTEVEALIGARLAELRHIVPQLRPWRGRVSGRRVLGARSPSERGQAAARGAARGVTRIDFEFVVEAEPGAPAIVALACRSTVRGRDRETGSARIEVAEGAHGAAGRQHVSTWIEEAVLAFAHDWFAARRAESDVHR
jgi:hypothetical protein